MLRAVLDTHTLIWYLYGDSRLSSTARDFIEQTELNDDQLALSSISLSEILYLSERNRIPENALEQLFRSLDNGGLLIEVAFNRQIIQFMMQIERLQVPELPDRIIAATALSLGVPLISCDRKIQLSSVQTIW